jgi:hypothetical protein
MLGQSWAYSRVQTPAGLPTRKQAHPIAAGTRYRRDGSLCISKFMLWDISVSFFSVSFSSCKV